MLKAPAKKTVTRKGSARPKLVVASLFAPSKLYIRRQWFAAAKRLSWPGEVSLQLVLDGMAPEALALDCGLSVETCATTQAVVVPYDNAWGSGRVALLREVARQQILAAYSPEDFVLWLDCDVIAPADTAVRLAAHEAVLASGLVLARGSERLITKAHFSDGHLLDPAQLKPSSVCEVDCTGFGCLLMRVGTLALGHWQQEEFDDFVHGGYGEDGHFIRETCSRVTLDAAVRCVHYDSDLVGYYLAQKGGRLMARKAAPKVKTEQLEVTALVYVGEVQTVDVNGVGQFKRNEETRRGEDIPEALFDSFAEKVAEAKAKHKARSERMKAGTPRDQCPVDYDLGLIKFNLVQGTVTRSTPTEPTEPK